MLLKATCLWNAGIIDDRQRKLVQQRAARFLRGNAIADGNPRTVEMPTRDAHLPSALQLIFHDHPRHSCSCSDERPLLNVRHDERTDRAVIAAVSETHMAMMILTGLDLLTREQAACWNVKPARNCLHQLIAGHRKAIHIAAAG
jgi:hypothetical protein